ncbi:MAG: carboxylating nicotinate-nucleotide diphosphorylase [Planctomycetaceae bacterium]|nr:carboxylating nicotinate-nucleotide diphosphorylase [Planctomycetaceae bacterium]
MQPAFSSPGWGQPEEKAAQKLVSLGLEEDFGERGDVTSANFVDAKELGTIRIVCRQRGVLSGMPIAPLVIQQIDERIQCEQILEDGSPLEPGSVIAILQGPARSMLMAERTILNFLTHLSGIASRTREFVEAVAGTSAAILDTRKTLPGYRRLQKYAVRCGGGQNHRMGLYDAVMLKDNHLAAITDRDPADVVQELKQKYDQIPVIVEVDRLDQLSQVFQWKPDVVLLDNMPPEVMRAAVELRNQSAPQVQLEASGGVNLETVSAIAATGVDRISIGSLTHSSPACDIGFDWS